MPLDVQSQAILDEMTAVNVPPYHTLSPETLRSIQRRALDPGVEVAKVEDRHIPGPGGDIPVRVYTPPGVGPFPALVWFHGGGWVLGNLDISDGTCRRLAMGAQCVVVSVDYRLAPENKFPAAADDCYAATAWVAQNGATINVDGARLAVSGSSAGGNLTASVSLMARDRGGPPLALQIMVVPALDYNCNTRSCLEKAEGYSVTRNDVIYFWNHYLRDEADAKNPYAAPMQAEDLSGLPPTLIMTAEYDPLCDDGAGYAERLKQAGVPTTYTCYQGTIHIFFGAADKLDQGKRAMSQAVEALKSAFAG